MYIQPITSNNVSMGAKPPKQSSSKNLFKRVAEKLYDTLPDATLKESDKGLEKKKSIESLIAHPAVNRVIMGATAIVTQPVIDAHNPRVDEKTRKTSKNRTMAKIIAGTGVGVIVRDLCYEVVQRMTNLEGKGKYSNALVPKAYLKDYISGVKNIKSYRNALSTIIAIFVMLFTNFLLDAPLTRLLTNKFNAKTAEKEKLKEGKEAVYA
jgi:hypothetical protein